MKAVLLEKFGEPDVLSFKEFPNPKPKNREAIIRVKACALNRLDIWMRKGGTQIPLPHIMGSDVAGIVEEINGKSNLNIGQEVVINPSIPCNSCEGCKTGMECEQVKILGYNTSGGYAEFVAAPIEQIYPKPKELSFQEAAAFPLTFLTAWHMLAGRANLKKNETVFIWGASGGLGSAAIQIAKYLEANIIVAANSDKIASSLKKVGANEAVIYSEENVEEKVKKLTKGIGVDVVFESIGNKTWNTSLNILRPFGRVVIAGTTSGDMGTQDLSDIYFRQLTILGARMGTKKEFEEILPLMGKTIKPIIDTEFPLKDAWKAHQRMEEAKHLGKIILKI